MCFNLDQHFINELILFFTFFLVKPVKVSFNKNDKNSCRYLPNNIIIYNKLSEYHTKSSNVLYTDDDLYSILVTRPAYVRYDEIYL